MSDLFPPTREDAIAEVKRELAQRAHVYPRFIAARRMSAEEAGRRNARPAPPPGRGRKRSTERRIKAEEANAVGVARSAGG